MTTLTLKSVNKALAAEGLNLELHKGAGYFYFTGPDSERAECASVFTYRLNDQPLETWVRDARSVREAHQANL